MDNNIGTTNQTLPRVIGETMDFDTPLELSSITILSGELSLGFLLFDDNGTMAVCSKIIVGDTGDPTYTFKTSTKDTEIDIHNILLGSY